MARTRLRERHQEHLRRKLAYLQQNQGITTTENPLFPSGSGSTNNVVAQIRKLQHQAAIKARGDEQYQITEETAKQIEVFENCKEMNLSPEPSAAQPSAPAVSSEPEAYDSGLYSPVLLTQADVEIDAVLYDAQDDWAKLEFQVSPQIFFSISAREDCYDLSPNFLS